MQTKRINDNDMELNCFHVSTHIDYVLRENRVVICGIFRKGEKFFKQQMLCVFCLRNNDKEKLAAAKLVPIFMYCF